MKIHKKNRFHFSNFIITIVVVIITAVLAFYNKDFLIGKISLLPYFSQTKIISNENKPLFVKHNKLGYTTNEGSYKLILKNTFLQKELSSDITINNEGYRFSKDKDNSKKKNLWLFGCSYNWGWGINDNQTISALLSEKLRNYSICDYSVPGYGNVQALIQLKELLKKKKCDIALFMYSCFHDVRNVASPSRLAEIQTLREFFCPAASIENSKLKIKMIPIKTNALREEPSAEEASETTKKIFSEIYNLCSENNIPAVLCVQGGSLKNPVVAHAKNLGFRIFDLTFDLREKNMNNLPFDNHPSTTAQKKYSERIIKSLHKNKLIKKG